MTAAQNEEQRVGHSAHIHHPEQGFAVDQAEYIDDRQMVVHHCGAELSAVFQIAQAGTVRPGAQERTQRGEHSPGEPHGGRRDPARQRERYAARVDREDPFVRPGEQQRLHAVAKIAALPMGRDLGLVGGSGTNTPPASRESTKTAVSRAGR